jgi:hypothetical protein
VKTSFGPAENATGGQAGEPGRDKIFGADLRLSRDGVPVFFRLRSSFHKGIAIEIEPIRAVLLREVDFSRRLSRVFGYRGGRPVRSPRWWTWTCVRSDGRCHLIEPYCPADEKGTSSREEFVECAGGSKIGQLRMQVRALRSEALRGTKVSEEITTLRLRVDESSTWADSFGEFCPPRVIRGTKPQRPNVACLALRALSRVRQIRQPTVSRTARLPK